MPVKKKFETGQIVGGFEIVDQAESKNGFARWNVKCTSCGETVTVRGVALASDARHACAPQRAAAIPEASTQPSDAPSLALTNGFGPNHSAEPAELQQLVADLDGKVQTLATTVEALEQTIRDMRAGPAPQPSGIRNLTMKSPVKPSDLEYAKYMGNLNLTDDMPARRQKMAENWAEIGRLVLIHPRTEDVAEELRARMAMENYDYQFIDTKGSAARQQRFLDMQHRINKDGPYQPPLED